MRAMALLDDVDEHLDALNYKIADHANGARSLYQSKRWQITRISTAVAQADHKKHMAKTIGQVTYKFLKELSLEEPDWHEFYDSNVLINLDKAAFKPTWHCLFTNRDTDVVKFLSGASQGAPDNIAKKIKSLDSLLVQTQEWVGTSGHVKGASLSEDFLGQAKLIDFDKPGSESWLLCAYQAFRRSDALSIVTPGAAVYFEALDQDFIVWTAPIAEVLDKGISYQDFETWLESFGGQAFLKTSVEVIVLKKGWSLLIPAGMFYGTLMMETAAYLPPAPVEGDEVSDEKHQVVLTEDLIGHALITPLLVKAWHAELQENVRGAVVSMNKACFDARPDKTMWTQRKASFDLYTAA